VNKFWLIIGVAVVSIGLGVIYKTNHEARVESLPEKLYVAVEGEGRIAVIDPGSLKVVRSVDLAQFHEGERIEYFPHNVQVAPDGKTVWVTANVGTHDHASENMVSRLYADVAQHLGGHDHAAEMKDEVIVIDPESDTIVKRIPLGSGLHLAHVVVGPRGFAWVSAQTEGIIYKINAQTYEVVQKIVTPKGGEPHGMRLSPDGNELYVAMTGGKSMGIFNTDTASSMQSPLGGKGVQTGVTPDGRYAFVSIFDTKQVMVMNVATRDVTYVKLPADAKGPVQLYPTSDSKFVYVADQGYYFGAAVGTKLFKIDLTDLRVVGEVEVGKGPHGVVLNKSGNKIFVTNLLEKNVAVVDAVTGRVLNKIEVGKEPNGVSFWSRTEGGTP
jgi:YVTN family beta-propeller protein